MGRHRIAWCAVSGVDRDTIRVGTIGYTYGILNDGEIPIRVTARGIVGDHDVITYETIDRAGGNYVSAMFANDLMPETSPETQKRWKRDGYSTIGTYPAFRQSDDAP